MDDSTPEKLENYNEELNQAVPDFSHESIGIKSLGEEEVEVEYVGKKHPFDLVQVNGFEMVPEKQVQAYVDFHRELIQELTQKGDILSQEYDSN